MPEGTVTFEVERAFRGGSGRAIATLARRFGDIDLAEEMVQEAFLVALVRWPDEGVPPSPVGWIITTARNAFIDRLRREGSRAGRHAQAMDLLVPPDVADAQEEGPVADDQLRMMFTCCHPALAVPSQVALTLRLVAGLRTSEIARAFLLPETTLAQRLVRAKAKIRDARIPYRIPERDELPGRLRAVLSVIYLVFNEGYIASSGPGLDRAEIAEEAVRLARTLCALLPEEPEARGLLALLLLVSARRAARVALDGSLVRLSEQDRTRWDRGLIAEGQALVRQCLAKNAPGPYQVQAAIQAVHSDAATIGETDWRQIVDLYDLLLLHAPTAVVALNRAIAVAEVAGPAAALALVEDLVLPDYPLLQATRADLLERLGRQDEAIASYDRALQRTTNQAEQALLRRRRDACARRGSAS